MSNTGAKMESGPSGGGLRQLARHAGAVFVSTLGVQLTTFAIVALCGRILPIVDFARMSVMVATLTLAMSAFDFGMNITMTKMYGDTRDDAYLSSAFGLRLLMLPVGVLIGAVLWLSDMREVGVGIALGALMSLWNGARATDQARQDYRGFVRANAVFMLLRLGAGLLAIKLTRDPFVIVAAIYSAPVIAIIFTGSATLFRRAFSGMVRPTGWVLRYVLIVYLNQLAFIAIPYAPQFLIDARLDAVDVGRYGLILTFTAPVALVIMSIRTTLLPKLLGGGSDFEQMLWSFRGGSLIFALWCLLMCGAGAVAWFINHFYGIKYPDLVIPYLLYFGGFVTTGMIGFLSLSVHTRNVPHYNMIVNLLKVAVVAPLLYLFGFSLMAIIIITISVMVIGEILLALWLHRRMT